ncbi:uncharacterized protein [Symphalangus syndactylus]|uniref:uncharacterized protein n=1 Tax=Symphalangus syndactylus TaxID=9590 RepID=UPI003005B8EE
MHLLISQVSAPTTQPQEAGGAVGGLWPRAGLGLCFVTQRWFTSLHWGVVGVILLLVKAATKLREQVSHFLHLEAGRAPSRIYRRRAATDPSLCYWRWLPHPRGAPATCPSKGDASSHLSTASGVPTAEAAMGGTWKRSKGRDGSSQPCLQECPETRITELGRGAGDPGQKGLADARKVWRKQLQFPECARLPGASECLQVWPPCLKHPHPPAGLATSQSALSSYVFLPQFPTERVWPLSALPAPQPWASSLAAVT